MFVLKLLIYKKLSIENFFYHLDKKFMKAFCNLGIHSELFKRSLSADEMVAHTSTISVLRRQRIRVQGCPRLYSEPLLKTEQERSKS